MIKICGISDIKTAEVAINAGATAIGFVFATSPRQVTPEQAGGIAREIPRHIERIGVFRHTDLDDLEKILRLVDLTAIQVHRAEELPLTLHGREVIPGVRVEFAGDYQHGRVLVDSPLGEGSGVAWSFEDVRRFAKGKRVILAGGLTPDNVADAVRRARPHGVDVSSGVESDRGVKDHGLVRAFVQAAKEALGKCAGIGAAK
ncbi:MAG: phosphoribosylanthranilate isomerase [Planctomycetes bacterium]|nr:phosphoribosylanthranilate isomerase [Planctomycetota bacterium]